MTKQFRTIRVYRQDKEWFDKMLGTLHSVENKPVSHPELLRRIKNIPNLDNVLITDSKINKRRRIQW